MKVFYEHHLPSCIENNALKALTEHSVMAPFSLNVPHPQSPPQKIIVAPTISTVRNRLAPQAQVMPDVKLVNHVVDLWPRRRTNVKPQVAGPNVLHHRFLHHICEVRFACCDWT